MHERTSMNWYKPDPRHLLHLLQASKNITSPCLGYQLHSFIIRSGFLSNIFISTSLISFYSSFDLITSANFIFSEIPNPSLVSWNALISGTLLSGQYTSSLLLFSKLHRSHLFPDAFSLSSALTSCARLEFFLLGSTIHSLVCKLGFQSRFVVVSNCLIHLYGKCGRVDDAIRLFFESGEADNFTWNSVISACARNGRLHESFGFFDRMPYPDTVSHNELINGIAQFGRVEDAIKIAVSMPNPNSSSWNSIITACVNSNRNREALFVFSKMHSTGVRMNQYTFSSTLSGIAAASFLQWGIRIHCFTIKCNFDRETVTGSALLDMYSKCGEITTAMKIFRSIPMKNTITWNAIMSGLLQNGRWTTTIDLVEEMKKESRLKPDEITLVSIITACYQGNRSDCARTTMDVILETMEEHMIQPSVEQCTAMIRGMAKTGEVWRSGKMIEEIGLSWCGKVWGAVVSGCEESGEMRVAEMAAAKVIEIGGEEGECVHVTLCKMYTSFGKWRKASLGWGVLRGKIVACSFLD